MNPTPTPPVSSHASYGVIGAFHDETQSTKASHSNPNYTTSNVQNTPTSTPSPSKTSEVNSIQSMPASKNQRKKKGNGRNKEENNNNQQYEKPKT
jgi:hypothetical protein